MSTFLSRYLAGEYEAVWAELRALGPAVRDEPIASDANAVARETMRRAKENVERIVARLGQIGYRFEIAPLSTWIPNPDFHRPPSADLGGRIAELEATAGRLPLSLRAWYEIVGEVDLEGGHPDWDQRVYSDPLVVEGLAGWDYEYRDWQYDVEGEDVHEPFVLPIAPDFFHKANVSGGAPYGVALPCESADAILVDEWHETYFVDYLRIAFRWGGFPGWERLDLGRRPGEHLPASVRPAEHLAYLSDDLLPL